MLFTHPDRSHKPLRPRASRPDRRDTARSAGVGCSSGAGPPPWSTTATAHGFHVGGNAFFPGSSSHGMQPKEGLGKFSGGGMGVGGAGTGADGDVTMVEPGRVSAAV